MVLKRFKHKIFNIINGLDWIEKLVILFLLIAFLFPLTLPNNYTFGFIEINPPKYCPFRDDIDLYDKSNSFGLNQTNLAILSELQLGGRYENEHCNDKDKQRVAILVPYRNRTEHLNIFLRYMHNFLMKQNQIDYQIFIIEQADNGPFNRAKISNAGFIEALKIDPYIDCFIFHDVDILPMNLDQTYVCTSFPKHLCSYLDKFRYVLIYPQLFGGVISIQTKQFKMINGYSNRFSGWGGEDDDLYQRVKNRFGHIERYSSSIARCIMLQHPIETNINAQREDILKDSAINSSHDGLSTLTNTYVRTNVDYLPLYVKISIELI